MTKHIEWQPIEAAPKDGTYLLLCAWTEYDGMPRASYAIGSWRTDYNYPDEDPQWFDDSYDDFSTGYCSTPITPTHYALLECPIIQLKKSS